MSIKVIFSLLLGGLLTGGLPSWAATTCVQNLQQFEEQKSNLPQVLHELPLLLAVDNFLVTAGLKIRTVGDKLKLEGSVRKPGSVLEDDAYVDEACYDGEHLVVKLENGSSYEAKVVNASTVSISGMSFRVTTPAKFAAIVEKVKKAGAKRNSGSSDSGSNSNRRGVQ